VNATPDWVVIARTGRTRGLRGELYARGWEGPERLLSFGQAAFRRPDGTFVDEGREFRILEAKPYKDGLVLRLEGVDSIEAAEPLEHCEMVAPAASRPPPPEGGFHFPDLVGCTVVEQGSGRVVGRVTGWQEFGGPELLEVVPEGRGPEAVIWIPLVRTICVEIDPANRRIVIDPPEGLLDLND
jgi:16S rRNA processing protein RimM